MVLFPYAESKRIVLRPATADDGIRVYEILFRLGRSTLPTVDTFLGTFDKGVAARFLIQRRDSDEVVGFSELTDLSPAGHVRAAVHTEAAAVEGIAEDAMTLTTNFAFANWRIRKVYFWSTDPDSANIGLGSRHAELVRKEGVFPGYRFFQGRLWDVHVYSVARESWDEHGVEILKDLV